MPEIQFRRIKVVRGPNIWARRPVLECLVNIGKYEDLPSDQLPGFTERLIQLIPSLYGHHCSEGRPGGFFERLRMGTWIGHIMEHVALEIQLLAGMHSSFGRTRSTSQRGEYHVVVDYKDPEAAQMCMLLAAEIVESFAENRDLPFSLEDRIAEIRSVGEGNVLGPSTRAIVDAAKRRGIPWHRMNGGSLVQLGHGFRQRRIQAAETSVTSNIGVEIASDKDLTKKLLENVGVPVPRGKVVVDSDGAWEAARTVGLPVVVKPADGNQGRAVSVNLQNEDQVRQAFELARQESYEVIVEKYITGNDYRLLVVNGQLVAAAHRRPAQVVGDGIRTIRQLVQEANTDPLRGEGHACALSRMRLDASAELALSKQEQTLESVPLAGKVVLLRDCSNLSTGGTATDVTDEVHPDTAALAVLAARTLDLDIAGIDVICKSIRRPLSDQGAVVEVNAAPGLRMHIHPSHGRSRPVGDAIIDMLFPHNTPARIPIVAVTGTNGKTTVTRMIAHVFATMKHYVGMTNTDGVYFDGVRRIKGDCSGPASAESVLQHPLVTAAVLETARGGILRAGLAWDRCSVGVVLNVAADHLGQGGIDTVEQLARVKRVVVEEVARDGYAVLNAEDPLVADMAEHCRGGIIYFALDHTNALVSRHEAAGNRAVYVKDGYIVLAHDTEETALLPIADIPATMGGLVSFQVQNALAATAACWGAGVSYHYIRHGLRTFQSDSCSTPGRFNVFSIAESRVIVDYAHNPHALQAITTVVKNMQPARSIAVVTAPGDRRDQDIVEMANIVAQTFTDVVVKEDEDKRGRQTGEVARIVTDALRAANPQVRTTTVIDELQALEYALSVLGNNEVLVVFADKVDEVVEAVERAAQDPTIRALVASRGASTGTRRSEASANGTGNRSDAKPSRWHGHLAHDK